MHRPLDPDTIGVPKTGYDVRPAPTSRKPLTTGDHWLVVAAEPMVFASGSACGNDVTS